MSAGDAGLDSILTERRFTRKAGRFHGTKGRRQHRSIPLVAKFAGYYASCGTRLIRILALTLFV